MPGWVLSGVGTSSAVNISGIAGQCSCMARQQLIQVQIQVRRTQERSPDLNRVSRLRESNCGHDCGVTP